MIGWFRKPDPRTLPPEPSQLAAALEARRLAEQIVTDGRAVHELAAWLLRTQREYRKKPEAA